MQPPDSNTTGSAQAAVAATTQAAPQRSTTRNRPTATRQAARRQRWQGGQHHSAARHTTARRRHGRQRTGSGSEVGSTTAQYNRQHTGGGSGGEAGSTTVEHSQYFILFHFNLFSYNNLSSSCGLKELDSQLKPVSGAAEKGKSLAQTELFKDPQKTHKPWVRVGRGYGFARVQPVPETVRTVTRKPRVYPNPCHALGLMHVSCSTAHSTGPLL